ncbi:MAG: ACT domain-containing protein, partial [bacterium]|nr:ACT domain-containing protein [bacterium]
RLCVPENRKNFFREDPHRLIEVFALAQRYGLPIADGTKQEIVASLRLVNHGFRSSDAVRETFVQILCAANGVVATLRQMHEVRFLGKYIPEFGALTALVQHELYHVYTVDEHTLNAMEYLERLRGTPYPEDRFYAELLRKVRNREVLYLALLLHDIGRAMGHGHVNRGGKAVPVITHRMGLSKETGKTIEFLVRNHLVMTHLSQRRDIHDFKLVAQLARAVRNVDQLRMLTLLTYGDIRGVGPTVWNEWKDMLLRELFRRTEEQLLSSSGDAAGEALLAHLKRIQARIGEEGAPLFGQEETERMVGTLPDHYLLSTPHGVVMTHLAMIREAEAEGLVTRWKHDPDRGYSELYICAYDSDAPGFFSRIAGVLAARGINILGARIYTTTQGIVIDTVQIESPGETERADRAYWQDVARSIRSVIQGIDRVDQVFVEHRPPSYLRKRRGRKIPTRIEFDNTVSETRTVIDVSTEDRIGLLFRVTSCLARQGVQIHSAKVATEEDRAIDAFYVTDIFGLKITDESKLAALKRKLLKALKGEGFSKDGVPDRISPDRISS